jgi:hypothetical protein
LSRFPGSFTTAIGRIPQPVVRLQDAGFASSSGSEKWSFNPMAMAGLDQESQFKKQMADIAAVPKWSLGVYCEQLDKVTGSIRAKVTAGLLGSKEVADAKQSQKVAECLMKAVGRDADVEALRSLGKIDRLKISNDAGVSEETLREEIFKFEQTFTIYRLIKELEKRGKEIPKSSEEMRKMMQIYGPSFLTKEEKKKLKKVMMRQAKSGRGLPGLD